MRRDQGRPWHASGKGKVVLPTLVAVLAPLLAGALCWLLLLPFESENEWAFALGCLPTLVLVLAAGAALAARISNWDPATVLKAYAIATVFSLFLEFVVALMEEGGLATFEGGALIVGLPGIVVGVPMAIRQRRKQRQLDDESHRPG